MTPKERTEFRFTLSEEEQRFLILNDEAVAETLKDRYDGSKNAIS